MDGGESKKMKQEPVRMAEEEMEESRKTEGNDRQRDKRKEIKKSAKEEGCVEDICLF